VKFINGNPTKRAGGTWVQLGSETRRTPWIILTQRAGLKQDFPSSSDARVGSQNVKVITNTAKWQVHLTKYVSRA
jgi:hypothetical protein